MSSEMNSAGRKPTLANYVAANLRAEMSARRLTPNDLARVLNIGPRAAARRLSGDIDLTLNELDIVATWLSMPRAQLLRERELMAVAS